MEHYNRISDSLMLAISEIRVEWAREKLQAWVFQAEETINEAQYAEDVVFVALNGSDPEFGYIFIALADDNGYYNRVDVFDWSDGESRQDQWTFDQYIEWCTPQEDCYETNWALFYKLRNRFCDLDWDTGRPFTPKARAEKRGGWVDYNLQDQLKENRNRLKRKSRKARLGDSEYSRLAERYNQDKLGRARYYYRNEDFDAPTGRWNYQYGRTLVAKPHPFFVAKQELPKRLWKFGMAKQAKKAIRIGTASRLKRT